MNLEQIVPAISLIAIIILILPAFLRSNSNINRFFKNLAIWAIIVLIVMLILLIIN